MLSGRVVTFALMLILAFVLAACGGDDDGDDTSDDIAMTDDTVEEPTPTPEPEPTATPEPTPTPEPEPTPDEPAEDLMGYVLSVDDVPEGFELVSEDSSGPDDPDPMGADESMGDGFCDVAPPEEPFQNQGSAEVDFVRGELGPFLFQSLGHGTDEEEAIEMFNWTRQALDCDEWVDEAEDLVWDVSPLEFPEVGDESFAVRAATQVEFLEMEMDLVLLRQGEFVTFLMHMHMDEIDTGLTEELVQTIVDKFEQGNVAAE